MSLRSSEPLVAGPSPPTAAGSPGESAEDLDLGQSPRRLHSLASPSSGPVSPAWKWVPLCDGEKTGSLDATRV